jgi:hypothetical protein
MNATRTRSWTRRIVLLGASVAAMVGMGTQSASAYSQPWHGSPGGLTPYVVQSAGVYTGGGGGVQNYYVHAGLRVFGPTVSRSNAAYGHQRVGYLIVIQRWNGAAWITDRTVSGGSWWMAPGTASMRLPDQLIALYTGTFRVQLSVNWADETGRVLGGQVVNYWHAGDYQCVYSHDMTCSPGQGWISIQD